MSMEKGLARLAAVSPGIAAFAFRQFEALCLAPGQDELPMIVDDTILGLAHSDALGKTIFNAHLCLVRQKADVETIKQFSGRIKIAADRNPLEADIIARFFGPVLACRQRELAEKFDLALGKIKLRSSFHSIHDAFALVVRLVGENDIQASRLLLDLLIDVFSAPMSFAVHQHLIHEIPRAIFPLSRGKRSWQLGRLRRLALIIPEAFDHLITGFGRGLCHLSESGFELFMARALDMLEHDQIRGERFLALESRVATDLLNELRTLVMLDTIQAKLQRYITLRTSVAFTIRPFDQNSGKIRVSSNGGEVFLPREFDRYPDKERNRSLATCLVRLEAGYHEWGTFLFDLEKFIDRYVDARAVTPLQGLFLEAKRQVQNASGDNDLTLFFSCFSDPALARNLFTLAEHTRIMHRARRFYPGMVKQVASFVEDETNRMADREKGTRAWLLLYSTLTMGRGVSACLWPEMAKASEKRVNDHGLFNRIESLAARLLNDCCPVEASGAFVVEAYPLVEQSCLSALNFTVPFYRDIDETLYFKGSQDSHTRAAQIKEILDRRNLKVYRSDIHQKLIQNNNAISMDDIKELVLDHRENQGMGPVRMIPGLSELLTKKQGFTVLPAGYGENVSVYREWDYSTKEYRNDHVWVQEIRMPCVNNDFYRQTLNAHQGLVKKIRHTFELLKPENMKILRQSPEGDAFDYRALVDFAVDRKARLTPNENIYIRRLKQDRNVAVTLLIDQSRSTTNPVDGSEKTVLDMEKEAVVLFCEALEVVGDCFSVAGYSGSGRHGVMYHTIKGFDEPLDRKIKNRVDMITAQSSTRTGAAIRHAVSRLDPVAAKIKLILLLGDGFPNDVDYKHAYAVEDTRKAISEAHAKNIVLRAVTVNISTVIGFDDLYGAFRHNVIQDLRQLPDKLLSIYGALTR